MPQNLVDNCLVLYDADNPHQSLAVGAGQGIDLPGSGPGQAPIF